MENHHVYLPNKKQGSAGRLIFNLLPQGCENSTFFRWGTARLHAKIPLQLKHENSRV